MGVYYEIVNSSKRQYLRIDAFGENDNWRGVITGWKGQSLHAIAVAWLVCRFQGERLKSKDDVSGTWSGDPIYLASDSAGPDLDGIHTSTEDRPEQNLYALAWREFEDITPRVMAAICDKDEEIANALVAKTYIAGEDKQPCWVLRLLVVAAAQPRGLAIQDALERRFGPDWKEDYAKAEKLWSKADP